MHALNRLLIAACQPKLNAKIISLLDAAHHIPTADADDVEQLVCDVELVEILHRVALDQGWLNVEQRVQEVISRLSSISITNMPTLHNAYTMQPQRRNATSTRGWQCSTGQMSPIREFNFGGVGVVIKQETDEGEIYKHRKGLALAGDFAGVGMVVWKAGPMLAECLIAEYDSRLNGIRILELGAGTGVLGLALAKHGAICTLTDVPHIADTVLQSNVTLNLEGSAAGHVTSVAAYTWGSEPPPELLQEPFDLIVAADVLYAKESFEILVDTIRRFSTKGVITWIGYQERGLQEDLFQKAAVGQGLLCELVPVEDLPSYHRGFVDKMRVLKLSLPAEWSWAPRLP